jgi:hypothetical protein
MPRKSDKQFQDLLSALETVLQQDHPNPNRVGCPPRSTLERLAQFFGGDLPVDQSVLMHITECYPCAEELKRLRAARPK